jgi:hypothetical protein
VETFNPLGSPLRDPDSPIGQPPQPSTEPEFEQFEDLARKIVSVPKPKATDSDD